MKTEVPNQLLSLPTDEIRRRKRVWRASVKTARTLYNQAATLSAMTGTRNPFVVIGLLVRQVAKPGTGTSVIHPPGANAYATRVHKQKSTKLPTKSAARKKLKSPSYLDEAVAVLRRNKNGGLSTRELAARMNTHEDIKRKFGSIDGRSLQGQLLGNAGSSAARVKLVNHKWQPVREKAGSFRQHAEALTAKARAATHSSE